jgi:hypothetical protein
MATLDITADGNLTNNSSLATTDRLLLIDDGTTSLQDTTISVVSSYLAALTQTLTNKTLTAPVVTALTLDGSKFSIGTSPHAAPAAGDLFFETDTSILWTYGTFAAASRWVSAELKSNRTNNNTAVRTGASIVLSDVSAGYDTYIDTLIVKADVLTTNDGSNYWTYNLRKVSGTTVPASAAGSSLATLNTTTLTAGTWGEVTASVNAVVDTSGAGLEIIFLDILKTGAPGNVWDAPAFSYRLVRP